jgi:hypothetical protein
MTNKETVDLLTFDLTRALAKSKLLPRKFDVAMAAPLARELIQHLELCRWRFD